MGFSCEHLSKVCQLCAAHKSLIPTLPAKIEAAILKEGWGSCAWKLARQDPRGFNSQRAEMRICLKAIAFSRKISSIRIWRRNVPTVRELRFDDSDDIWRSEPRRH